MRFPAVGEVEICQIEVSPATDPLIVKLTDRSGQKVERFFARSGNASQEIPLSEINSYMKERFTS